MNYFSILLFVLLIFSASGAVIPPGGEFGEPKGFSHSLKATNQKFKTGCRKVFSMEFIANQKQKARSQIHKLQRARQRINAKVVAYARIHSVDRINLRARVNAILARMNARQKEKGVTTDIKQLASKEKFIKALEDIQLQFEDIQSQIGVNKEVAQEVRLQIDNIVQKITQQVEATHQEVTHQEAVQPVVVDKKVEASVSEDALVNEQKTSDDIVQQVEANKAEEVNDSLEINIIPGDEVEITLTPDGELTTEVNKKSNKPKQEHDSSGRWKSKSTSKKNKEATGNKSKSPQSAKKSKPKNKKDQKASKTDQKKKKIKQTENQEEIYSPKSAIDMELG